MREWQVGDPIGDGNDIGVPDIPHMSYLKDNDESSKEDIADDFKHDINNARDYYNMKNYENAFFYLEYAFRTYAKMNKSEKSQVRANPFNQDWIIDLCCKIINNNSKYKPEATDFIIKNKYPVKLCMDCDCVYTIDYNCCIKCGKPLIKPGDGKSPEKIAEELKDILSNKIWDEFEISKLVNRSIVLMKSNDCRLVEIADSNYGIDFTFEKEHKYFKTRYVCEYVPGSIRVFEDFGVTHDHDKLLMNESFKKLIKDTENKTGFTFKECDGGYGSQLDDNRFDFIFNDKIYIIVRFDIGDGKIAVYDIDLDTMQLSEDYRAY